MFSGTVGNPSWPASVSELEITGEKIFTVMMQNIKSKVGKGTTVTVTLPNALG